MITAQDIAAAFNAAGIDDTDKLTAFVGGFVTNLKLRKIDAQIEDLAKKQADALKPIVDERTRLLNSRADLTADLPADQAVLSLVR